MRRDQALQVTTSAKNGKLEISACVADRVHDQTILDEIAMPYAPTGAGYGVWCGQPFDPVYKLTLYSRWCQYHAMARST
jgi:hypothetical protein